MKSTETGHKQVESTSKIVSILFLLSMIFTGFEGLGIYIFLAKIFSKAENSTGFLILLFFEIAAVCAVIIFITLIIRNLVLMKIDYYDDVKYMRDYMDSNAKAMQNGLPVKGSINIIGGGFEENATADNSVAPELPQEYYIYSKTNSAYFVGITQNDGIMSVTYSKNKDKAMKFKTKTAALEYANAHKLNANGSEFRIE